jgi:hypothetical protein
MKACNVDINELPNKKMPNGSEYSMFWYALPLFVDDTDISNRKLIIRPTGKNNFTFNIRGIGRIKATKHTDVCLGGTRRYIEVNNCSFVVVGFPKPEKQVKTIDQTITNKYYRIVKKMGLVSPLTSKRRFTVDWVTAVNCTKHSMQYLYAVVTMVRCLREEPLFVETFVNLVDRGLDPYSTLVGLLPTINFDAHFIFPTDTLSYSINYKNRYNIGYIANLYRLFKKGEHKKLDPINKGCKMFKMHETMTKTKYNSTIPSGLLLKYANTIAASVKRSYDKERPVRTDRLIAKIERGKI